jgi:hypothetical protein
LANIDELKGVYEEEKDIFNGSFEKYSKEDIDKIINGQSDFNANEFYIFTKYKKDYVKLENEIVDDNPYYITEIV